MTYPQAIYDTLQRSGPLTARQLALKLELHPDALSSYLTSGSGVKA